MSDRLFSEFSLLFVLTLCKYRNVSRGTCSGLNKFFHIFILKLSNGDGIKKSYFK